jgi:histone H3/H4
MSDYSFMKTGYDNTSKDAISETQFDLISLYLKMIQKAMTLAATYCDHAGRQVVTSKDLVKAMRYQARYFLDETTEHTLQEAREDLMDILMDDGDDDTEEYTVEEEEDEEDLRQCSCTPCTLLNRVDSEWDSWHPNDEILHYLKAQVDRMDRMSQ